MPESKSGALPLGDSPRILSLADPQGLPVQAARHEPAHVLRQRRQDPGRLSLRVESTKDTGAGAGHPRVAELTQPFEVTGNLRITPADHRFEIVATGKTTARAERKG